MNYCIHCHYQSTDKGNFNKHLKNTTHKINKLRTLKRNILKELLTNKIKLKSIIPQPIIQDQTIFLIIDELIQGVIEEITPQPEKTIPQHCCSKCSHNFLTPFKLKRHYRTKKYREDRC
jgi:hypothetical protein